METKFAILYRWTVCMVGLFGITACSNDETGGKGPAANKEFTVYISDVTPRGAKIAVTPKDRTLAYYFDVVSEKSLADNYGGDIETCFRSGLQQYIDRYAATLTPQEVLEAIKSVGNDDYTYRWLSDDSKYYVLVAGIKTTEPGTTTSVESTFFETQPLFKNAFTFIGIEPTDLSVKATVSSENAEIPYVTVLVKEDDFIQSGKSVEAFLDEVTQDAIAYATSLGVTLEDAVDALTETGESEFSQDKLSPAVDYLLLAAGVNSEGYVVTEGASLPVRTADPRKSEMTIEFRISDLSPTGAVIRYIPSVKNDRYFFDIAEASELDGLSDEQIVANRIEAAGSYIGFYTTYDDYDNDMTGYLSPGTEYVALAFGYISYTTTGLFRSQPFTTPSEQYAQDFGACTAAYYGDRFGVGRDNWLLKLSAADGSYSVELNCLSGAAGTFADGIPAGSYTFSASGEKGAFSILPDGSQVVKASDGSASGVASGGIEITYEQGVCKIATDVTDAEGHRIKGSFSGTAAATDYAGYPAIGEIVMAQARYYADGNWFINLYDYPLSGNTGQDTYNLAFDLYVSEAEHAPADGLPTGSFDIVASGLGVRDNGYTKLQFDSRKVCDIRSGTLHIDEAAEGGYTIAFRGACPMTDIDVRYTGAVALNGLPTGSLRSKGDGTPEPRNGLAAKRRACAAEAAAQTPRQPRVRIPDGGVALRRFDL